MTPSNLKEWLTPCLLLAYRTGKRTAKIYLELVSIGADSYKAVKHPLLMPVLPEALKEQQVQIEALEA